MARHQKPKDDKMKTMKITTWNLTLPNGQKMSGYMDMGKADQVNTNAGSLPLSVWLDGVEKIKAAGGSVETSESEIPA